jgi:hypothetical protein
MGVLAVYGYGLPEVNGKHSSQLNQIIQDVCLIIDEKLIYVENLFV